MYVSRQIYGFLLGVRAKTDNEFANAPLVNGSKTDFTHIAIDKKKN